MKKRPQMFSAAVSALELGPDSDLAFPPWQDLDRLTERRDDRSGVGFDRSRVF